VADYQGAFLSVNENIRLLSNSDGTVPAENVAIWNISNALRVVCEAVQEIQGQLKQLEQQSRR
jgi:hypothetical protein